MRPQDFHQLQRHWLKITHPFCSHDNHTFSAVMGGYAFSFLPQWLDGNNNYYYDDYDYLLLLGLSSLKSRRSLLALVGKLSTSWLMHSSFTTMTGCPSHGLSCGQTRLSLFPIQSWDPEKESMDVLLCLWVQAWHITYTTFYHLKISYKTSSDQKWTNKL